jgi:hypothetical protein
MGENLPNLVTLNLRHSPAVSFLNNFSVRLSKKLD